MLLTGCFGGKETTTVCKSELYGQVTMDAEGDEIVKSKEELEFDIVEDFAITTTDESEIKANIELVLKMYKADGVKTKVESIKDGKAVVSITIDYKEANMDELAELELAPDDADYISLKMTIEESEDDGYTCKEK